MNGTTTSKFLNATEIKAINTAIKKAELSTAGEIKVLVVEKSSNFSSLGSIPIVGKMGKIQGMIHEKVQERANGEFFGLGMDHTRDHTGVLIMISLKERRVEVRAGEEINKKVAKNTWESVMEIIVGSIKSGTPEEGICQAVEKAGNILAEHFPRKEDDTNEISDEIIFKR